MRTTVDIDDALLAELREAAGRRRVPFKRVLDETLRLGWVRQNEAGKASRFVVKSHPLGLKKSYRSVSLNKLYDQMETEAARTKE